MKKVISALAFAVAVFTTAFAQEATVVESREVNGGLDFRNIYNMGAKTTYNRLSFQVHGGMNYLPCVKEYFGDGGYEFGKMNPTAGLQFEYTFTQYWGAGVDVTWIGNNQYNYDNNIFGFGIFGSANIANLLAPYRQWEKFGAFANFGITFPLTSWSDARTYAPDAKAKPIEDNTKFARPCFKFGPTIEYNLSEDFAVGAYVDALFSPFSTVSQSEKTNAIHPSRNGGRHMWMGGLTVRYKVSGHRNIRNFNPQKQTDYSLDLKEQLTMINKQNRRIDSLSKAFDSQMSSLEADNAAMKKQVKEQQDSIESLRSRNAAQAKTIYEMTEDESKMVKASLADLRFETGKAIIKKESYPALDNIVKLIQERREWNVMLSGYTDNSGDPGKNLMLSRDRAAAVKAYFVNKGIEAGRIQSAGYGDKDPIADNNTPTGRARNRRVELELYHRE